MDPNETLKLLRFLQWKAESGKFSKDDAKQFAELFFELDHWVCKGGFLPVSWAKNRE